MAGIEPASERFVPRKSTSVAGRACRHRRLNRQNRPVTIHSGPKAFFRAVSEVAARHSAFLSPTRSPGGVRERWTRPHLETGRFFAFTAYAATGSIAYGLVVLALDFLRWFSEVGASRLAFRGQPLPSKPVIPVKSSGTFPVFGMFPIAF